MHTGSVPPGNLGRDLEHQIGTARAGGGRPGHRDHTA